MKGYSLKKQAGFAGVVYLVVGLIAIVMAGIAYMSRGTATGTSEQAARTNASVMMKQASDFKAGFDRMLVNGVSAANITFDTTADTGLFDPAAGAQYAIKHVPPAGVVSTGTPAFTYTRQLRLPGIGSAAGEDYVVTVGNITVEVCRQVNRILWNDGAAANPASSTGTLVQLTTTPAAVNDSGITSANYLNRPEGCVAASGGEYVYYKVLAEF